MAENSCWGYVESLARFCLEMAVVADGLEDWIGIMVSCGFLWTFVIGFANITWTQEWVAGYTYSLPCKLARLSSCSRTRRY